VINDAAIQQHRINRQHPRHHHHHQQQQQQPAGEQRRRNKSNDVVKRAAACAISLTNGVLDAFGFRRI